MEATRRRVLTRKRDPLDAKDGLVYIIKKHDFTNQIDVKLPNGIFCN